MPGPASRTRGNFTPPRRTAASPAVDLPEPAPAISSRLSPRNWRVPTRLNAILLIPVLVGLVLGGFQVNASVETWQEARDAEQIAELVRAAQTYAHALIDERDRTAAPLLSGDTDSRVVAKARATTDAAKREFDERVTTVPDRPSLQRRLNAFQDVEGELDALRRAAYTSVLPAVKTEEGYVRVQHPLMEFANELGLGTGNITSYGRTVYAISLAKAAASLQRSIGMHLLLKPGPGEQHHNTQITAFTSYAYLENIALAEYTSGGTQEDTDHLMAALRQAQEKDEERVERARRQAEAADQPFVPAPARDEMTRAIGSGASVSTLKTQGITSETWFAAATGTFDAYRSVEKTLVDKAVADASQIAEDAKRDAFITGAIVVVALLAALVIAALMARAMGRSMRRLRNAAFKVAEQRLPMLVDQLSRTDPGRVDTRVQPIPITSHDEIGEVARAFDQVHREAVRLAAEQALLRGNVNAIFTNLSRRNQGLIEGQLTLITELENHEADPDQLENLFQLDHLATRMRRNGENLLVLAGAEPSRRWDQPVPLIDVMRAASSEVENYERIELTGVPDTDIHGTAVTDLVHLLAELLENATTFSSPQTRVRVTATRLPDGRVMIEIHDKGIGLTAEDFADINHRLANPPTVDAAISQRMGLFVVGRLAERHGIRVQLRPSGEQAGTTSLVMLPDAITHGGGGDQLPEDDFTVSRIVSDQPYPYDRETQQEPPRTAAEPGFDESRHGEAPDDPRGLDPVGRSQQREERRTALEAQGAEQQHPAFREQSEDAYLTQRGYQADDGHRAEDGYQVEQQPYDTGTYAQPGYPADYPEPNGYGESNGYAGSEEHAEAAYNGSATVDQQTYSTYDAPAHQGDRADSGNRRNDYGPDFGAESESGGGAAEAPERVGFDRPGPGPSGFHSVTGAGLPRREKQWQQQAGQPEQPQHTPQEDGSVWRSANDERWRRAVQLREPKAGGVTPSGLPRRVPKANLVEGTAEQTPQGGPQVSRAPEDVRGRLSNLRQGVQQGRNAGTDTNAQGFGPGGSTYDQER
jgi:signal transduction histidine kinase